jgi:hypothetical protein
VRAERDKARRLLAPMAARDFFRAAAEIVVAQTAKDSAQILNPKLVRFSCARLDGIPPWGWALAGRRRQGVC